MNIIIADKDKIIHNYIKDYIVQNFNIPADNIKICSDGKVVLDILKNEPCDLLICELKNLENMKGYSLLYNIQMKPSLDALPIIIISEISSKDYINAVRAITLDRKIHYVLKDNNLLSNLATRILNILQEKNSTKPDNNLSEIEEELLELFNKNLPIEKIASMFKSQFQNIPSDDKLQLVENISKKKPKESMHLFVSLMKTNIGENTTTIKESMINSLREKINKYEQETKKALKSLNQALANEKNFGELKTQNVELIQKKIIKLLLSKKQSLVLEDLKNVLFTPFSKTLSEKVKQYYINGLIEVYRSENDTNLAISIQHTIDRLFMDALREEGMIEKSLKIIILNKFSPIIKKPAPYLVLLKRLKNNKSSTMDFRVVIDQAIASIKK